MAASFSPDYPTALRLQDLGHGLEARRHFRGLARALIQACDDISPVLEMAGRLCQLHDHTPALELCHAAARRGTAADLVRIALLWRQEYQFAEAAIFAEMAVSRAATAGPVLLDARLILAECEERLGRLEASLALTELILKTHPGSLPAHRQRAAVLRRLGRLEEARECLAPLTRVGAPPHWETCRAWFELGHIEDECGHHAAAWKAWTTARLHYPAGANWGLYRQQADHVWSQVLHLHDSVTADQLHAWTAGDHSGGGGNPGPRPAILTGHPRSGTTLLEQSLEAHPLVESVEESTIFTSGVYRPLFQHGPPAPDPASRLAGLTLAEQAHWRREYSGMMESALGSQIPPAVLLDKNPDLLQLLPAFIRVLPGVRIIVMQRDPRDILVSMFAQALPPNHTSWSYRTADAAAGMISLRLGLWGNLRKKLPDGLARIIGYETAMGDYPRTVRETFDFLGLAPELPSGESGKPATGGEGLSGSNPAKGETGAESKGGILAGHGGRVVRSPTYAEVRKPVHTRAIGRWRHYEKFLGSSLPLLRDAVRDLGYD